MSDRITQTLENPKITGLKYEWDWQIHPYHGRPTALDIVIGYPDCPTSVAQVYAPSNNDEGVEVLKANAKAICKLPKMIMALFEARRVFKRDIEEAPDDTILGEHEYALGKIEDLLDEIGFEFEKTEIDNRK